MSVNTHSNEWILRWRPASLDSKLRLDLLQALLGQIGITCGELRGSSPPSLSDQVTQGIVNPAVIPTALALLTAVFLFGGRTKRTFEDVSHTAAGILVALFLICATIILIAAAFINTVIASD